MTSAGILKRGYLYDKKVGLLPMTVVSSSVQYYYCWPLAIFSAF